MKKTIIAIIAMICTVVLVGCSNSDLGVIDDTLDSLATNDSAENIGEMDSDSMGDNVSGNVEKQKEVFDPDKLYGELSVIDGQYVVNIGGISDIENTDFTQYLNGCYDVETLMPRWNFEDIDSFWEGIHSNNFPKDYLAKSIIWYGANRIVLPDFSRIKAFCETLDQSKTDYVELELHNFVMYRKKPEDAHKYYEFKYTFYADKEEFDKDVESSSTLDYPSIHTEISSKKEDLPALRWQSNDGEQFDLIYWVKQGDRDILVRERYNKDYDPTEKTPKVFSIHAYTNDEIYFSVWVEYPDSAPTIDEILSIVDFKA